MEEGRPNSSPTRLLPRISHLSLLLAALPAMNGLAVLWPLFYEDASSG